MVARNINNSRPLFPLNINGCKVVWLQTEHKNSSLLSLLAFLVINWAFLLVVALVLSSVLGCIRAFVLVVILAPVLTFVIVLVFIIVFAVVFVLVLVRFLFLFFLVVLCYA